MARRQKIPTPLLQRWRQFRYQVVPVVSFAVATILVVMIWRQQISASHVVGEVMTRQVLLGAANDGQLMALEGKPLELNDEVKRDQVLAVFDRRPLDSQRAILERQLAEASAKIRSLEDEINQERQRIIWEEFDRKWNVRAENTRARGDAMRLIAAMRDTEAGIVRARLQRQDIAKQQRELDEKLAKVAVLIQSDIARGRELGKQIQPLAKARDAKKFVDAALLLKLESERAEVIATYKENLNVKSTYVAQKQDLADELKTMDSNIAEQQKIHDKLLAEIDQADLSAKLKQELKDSPFVSPDGLTNLTFVPPEIEARKAPLVAQEKTFAAMIAKIDNQINSLTICAPFSGKVTMIHAWPGQAVTAGDPVVTIAASQGQFIVTYVRQNQRFHPHPNDDVEIRTRTSPILVRTAKIQDIGAQVEMVPAHQLRDPKSQEWGTPVRIAVPQDLAATLRPGELVDIRFPPKPAEALPANTLAPGTLVGSVLAPAGK